MTKTRWVRVLALLLPLMLVLAACPADEPDIEDSPAPEEPDAPDDADPGEADDADPIEAEMEELYQAALDEGPIVVYGPAAETRQPLWDLFMEEFPGLEIEGVVVTGPELRERIETEVATGRHIASVVTTGGTAMVNFADDERFEVYRPPTLGDLDDVYRSEDGRIHTPTAFAFVSIYNTDEISEDEAPRTWRDIFEWSGDIVTGDPTAPVGALAFLTYRMSLDPDFGFEFLEEMAATEMHFLPATFEIGGMVARGEYKIGMAVPLQFVTTLVGEGAPVGVIWPKEDANHLSEHWFGVVEGAPAPNGARLLKSWMFTAAAQEALAEIDEYPLMPGFPGPDRLPPASDIPMFRALTFQEIREHTAMMPEINAIFEDR